MKTAIAITILALMQAAPPVPRKTVQNGGDRHNASQSETSTPQAVSGQSKSSDETPRANTDQQNTSPNTGKDEESPMFVRVVPPLNVEKDRADYLYIGGSLLLTVITLAIAATALIQASAAKAGVQAVINSERAWVLPDIIGQLPDIGGVEPNQLAFLAIFVPIKNFGKTVARVTQTSVRLYSLPKGRTALEPEPDYIDRSPANVVLPPEGTLRLPLGMAVHDFRLVKGGEMNLYIYGFVDYTDLGDIKRQSRFCYVYHVPKGFNVDPEGFYRCGNAPHAYTDCT